MINEKDYLLCVLKQKDRICYRIFNFTDKKSTDWLYNLKDIIFKEWSSLEIPKDKNAFIKTLTARHDIVVKNFKNTDIVDRNKLKTLYPEIFLI